MMRHRLRRMRFVSNGMNFKDKKVLVMGLGTLGGGIAAAKWFVRQGARVTVTDTRPEKNLAASVRALGGAAKKITFIFGEHREENFKENDVIVVNPAVPRESRYLAIAKKNRKLLVNDARVFFDVVKNPVIAVTGTRGKTTTTNWIAHFLKVKNGNVVAAGNSSDVALLDLADKLNDKKEPVVVELSSWQLELLPGARRAPDIAVITNLHPDHLNRYHGIKAYALAKANIFRGQKRSQKLILNGDSPWTEFFLRLRPKSSIFFFSLRQLPKNRNGIFLKEGVIFFRFGGVSAPVVAKEAVSSVAGKGEHNVANFMAAALAAHLAGVPWSAIARAAGKLPQIRYREEIVVQKKNFTVVNDSTATSPDAVIAAIRRFKSRGDLILITGGTDKNLDFEQLAEEIKKTLPPEDVFLLNGSATRKLVTELKKMKYFNEQKPQLFENLEDILREIKSLYAIPHTLTSRIILFSPGAASFEKFKNEFDRGEKFDGYAKKVFRQK